MNRGIDRLQRESDVLRFHSSREGLHKASIDVFIRGSLCCPSIAQKGIHPSHDGTIIIIIIRSIIYRFFSIADDKKTFWQVVNRDFSRDSKGYDLPYGDAAVGLSCVLHDGTCHTR